MYSAHAAPATRTKTTQFNRNPSPRRQIFRHFPSHLCTRMMKVGCRCTYPSIHFLMVMPGKRPLPRGVRGAEWPPRRATKDKSRLNLSISHFTSAPLFSHKNLANSGFFAPPLSVRNEQICRVLDAVCHVWMWLWLCIVYVLCCICSKHIRI